MSFGEAGLTYFAARAIDPDLAVAVGVVERGESILFPYVAPDGASYYRERSLNGGPVKVKQPTGQPLALWWPLGRPEAAEAVLVCEGESDALGALEPLSASRFASLAVVAVPGTGFPAHRLAEQLAEAGVQEGFLALDADEAGRKYADKAAGALRERGIRPIVVELEDGTDLADTLARVDDRADWIENALADAEAAEPLEPAAPEDGDTLLHDLAAFVRRFVVVTLAQAAVVALWIVHTHAIEAAEATPYLAVTSAEKRSGKSLLLEVLELLVLAALRTTNISDAAMFRSIAQEAPTLLFDEIDAVFGPKARDREDLRGMVNAGHRRGAEVRRVGGANRDKLERFPVFCPKALAGIGTLPDTVADRSLPIRLERKAHGERVERFRRRDVEAEAATLRERVEHFAAESLEALKAARPDLPADLDDRAQDGAEPLLSIADRAGGEWPEQARRAIVELRGGEPAEDDSIGVRLLADIRGAFEAGDVDRLSTADLLDQLHGLDEAPWAEWRGRPLTPQALVRLLGPYRVRSRSVRLDDGSTPKGYKREQFEDAFTRYLPSTGDRSRHNATTRMRTGVAADHEPPQDRGVAAVEEAENPRGKRDVAAVAATGDTNGSKRRRATENGWSAEAAEALIERAKQVCPGSSEPGVDADNVVALADSSSTYPRTPDRTGGSCACGRPTTPTYARCLHCDMEAVAA